MAAWTVYESVDREARADWLSQRLDIERPDRHDFEDDPHGAYVTCLACHGEFLELDGCDCWEPGE